VVYTYNRQVDDAQNVFASDDYAPLTQITPTTVAGAIQTTILVKEAPQLLVDYSASITVLPGYTKSLVIADVQTALVAYGATLLIGQIVYQTDLNEIVEGVDGVLRVSGTPTKFAPSTQSGTLNSITPNANAYIVLSNLNIS
jgi:hypothetical protein